MRSLHHSQILWACLLALFSFTNTAIADDQQLQSTLDKLLSSRCLSADKTAVSIVRIPDGQSVYAKNISTPLLPASILKISTTAAALHYLGPEYRFKTKVYHTGQFENGVISGDVYLKGYGDPSLNSERLWYITNQLKQQGINRIEGNLYADVQFFDDYDRSPHWKVKRSQRPYDAKIGALSLNFNTIAVHVEPAEQTGQLVNAWLDPAPAHIQLKILAKTTLKGRKKTVWARRVQQNGQTIIEVHGKLRKNTRKRTLFLNVDDPTRYTIESFRSYLSKAGVQVRGQTGTGVTPAHAHKLQESKSQPLSVVLKELNTYSNNLIAEQIIKTIAATQTKQRGSHAAGLQLVQQFYKQTGIRSQGIVLADGSGLSRQNQFTAQAMTDLLTNILPRFDIGPDFLSTLRVMGAQGVHSKRLKNSPAKAKIRAKTGTLYRVSTLAGYVPSEQGQLYAYALLLNDNRCGKYGADRIEDKIISAIYQHGAAPQKLYSTHASQYLPMTPNRSKQTAGLAYHTVAFKQ